MNKKALITIITLFVLAAAGSYLYITNKSGQDQNLKSEKSNQTVETSVNWTNLEELKKSGNGTPVFIWAEDIKVENSEERAWPTKKIYKKAGKQDTLELATVGTVGEYPSSFLLNSNKSTLFINLESKIQSLNTENGQITDLFKARKQIGVMTFSPDESKLFVHDQKYTGDDKEYFVHLIDLKTGQSETIKQGSNLQLRGAFVDAEWRDDSKVLLIEGLGEGGTLYYYDLNTNSFHDLNGEFGELNPDGSISTPSHYIKDMCNVFSGVSPAIYKMVDPLTKKQRSEIGSSDSINNILALSPDKNKVLYSSSKPLDVSNFDDEKCKQARKDNYKMKDLNNDQVFDVENPVKLANEWNRLINLINWRFENNQQVISIDSIELTRVNDTQALPTIIDIYLD